VLRLIDNRVSVNAFADPVMLLTLATMIANRLTILARTRLAAAGPRSRRPSPHDVGCPANLRRPAG